MKPEPQWAVHTDPPKHGWGGTGGSDEGPGRKGIREEAVIWTEKERKEHVTLGELEGFLGPWPWSWS